MNINDKALALFLDILAAIQADLMDDAFYAGQAALLQRRILQQDIDGILECQLTLHNMEVEAAYRAGHRDCLAYLSEIGKLIDLD